MPSTATNRCPTTPPATAGIRTFIADQPAIYNRIDLGESIFVF